MAKVECHPRELAPRIGIIVTNLSRPAKRIVAVSRTVFAAIRKRIDRLKPGPAPA